MKPHYEAILLLVSILKVAFSQGSQKNPWKIESASSDVLSASSVHKAAASEILTNKLHHKSSQVENADHLYVKSIKSMKGRQVEKDDGVDGRKTHVDRSPKIEQLRALKTMPKADGYLHLYVLPVGDGDTQILQCPNGDIAIIDLGSESAIDEGFWLTKEIKSFLEGHNQNIKNIVFSYHDFDNYQFLYNMSPYSKYLSGLRNMYTSCTLAATNDDDFQKFIKQINASTYVRTFNGGHACGFANGKSCESIALCPGNPEVVTRVLSANAGNCSRALYGVDSIVIGIMYKNFSMQLNGRFEDYSSNPTENGPMQKMVDFYGPSLQATVYKMSNPINECKGNKAIMLEGVKPKAIIISEDRIKCKLTDQPYVKKYLCKPAETDSTSHFYCGKHPVTDVTIDDKLQQEYECGVPYKASYCNSYMYTTRNEYNNEFAIYSTAPLPNKMNLVHLLTDGIKWGFVNNIQPRISRMK